ncbi:MAG: MOSC domain-containing protein [Rhodospirillales bacterium]|jgi:MOSC domain-containing protein YiiM|nr:MOSC domain-containing protein [Rhodospirillales bacterium]MBT4006399.1 MOSC domain-containing protein [Rhodospirillales bacterium]MBT5075141.1 MOSC domain-containing protein [Rhodospirillales bacterium]MBT5114276.1 MOSC domain-containing protein [Rhodospirillales bacterium]MBT5673146.1 MOSC domain-containing protein [Rhodospirillales bacterium]
MFPFVGMIGEKGKDPVVPTDGTGVLLSVNVAMPHEVTYQDRTYQTGIYKNPQPGRVALSALNLDGDGQGSPINHGGPDMAVYVYSRDHYIFWEKDMRENLNGARLPFGSFGENLTVTGMREDTVHIGDIFTIGSVRLQVSEPRTPCHKLAMKFDDPLLPKRFMKSGRVGFYFRVLQIGDVGAGDGIGCEARDPAKLSILETLALWSDKGASAEALERALSVSALSATWRGMFEKRLETASTANPGHQEWRPESLKWV